MTKTTISTLEILIMQHVRDDPAKENKQTEGKIRCLFADEIWALEVGGGPTRGHPINSHYLNINTITSLCLVVCLFLVCVWIHWGQIQNALF